ncbi:AAA family ATPase [Escherichia coli]|uniref:AAA family ATPase n=1 Tax=Escherichia coli TaxID=562 RepID=UPI003AFAE098
MSDVILSYSWSRRNARAGKKDINVRTAHTATLDDLKELIQPLDAVRDGINPKTAPGYITAACDSTHSTVKDPETGDFKQARKGFFYRCDASVSKSSLAYLDFDSTTPEEYQEAVRLVKRSRWAMCLYTTASHTDESPRFRVVMPLARPVEGGDIIRVRHGLLEHFFKGMGADRSGFTLSQPMYLPPVGATVIWSRRNDLIDPNELLEGIPAVDVSSASDYQIPEELRTAFTDAFEALAFEYGGVMTPRGLKMPATPEHAENYSDPTPRPDDFLLCFPREGYEAPNVTMIHDTDITATEGLSPKEVWKYACDATGLPFSEVAEAIGWGARESVSCSLDDLEDDEDSEEDELPEPVKADFVVEGYMPSDCIWDIVGESGTYKSFYTLGMMYLSAAGYRFAGADTQRCHHFYIDGEGGAATRTRIDALAAKYGEEGKDYVHVIDMGEILATHGDKKIPALIRRMRETAGDEPIGMVAFDTLNQTLALTIDKFDENSSSTAIGMGKVIAILKEVRDATKAAVGVVHHTPKGGKKARGSGALYAGVDVELTIERATDRQINVYHSKFKHGPQQKTVGMVLESVQFREAPPPKEYRAVEFLGSTEEYGTIVNLDLPEPHKALVLMPWGFEPFKTDEEKEREEGLTKEGKENVRKTVENAVNSSEATILAAFELAEGTYNGNEGITVAAANKLAQSDPNAKAFNSKEAIERGKIKKMVEAGYLVPGTDENNQIIPGRYRLNTMITDNKIPKTIYEPNEMLTVTEEDLE